MSGNLGPLTTTFTPPSTCLSSVTVYSAGVPPLFCNVGLPGYTSLDCFPSGYDANLNDNNWQLQFYSPGICPQSWELVPSDNAAIFASSLGVTTNNIGETIGFCCPPHYTLNPILYGGPALCRSNLVSSIVAAAIVINNEIVPTSVTVSAEFVCEGFVQVRWRGQDFAPSTMMPISTISPASTTASTVSSTTTSSGGDGPALEANIIALGVGIGIGLPATLAAIIGLWRNFVR